MSWGEGLEAKSLGMHVDAPAQVLAQLGLGDLTLSAVTPGNCLGKIEACTGPQMYDTPSAPTCILFCHLHHICTPGPISMWTTKVRAPNVFPPNAGRFLARIEVLPLPNCSSTSTAVF